MNTAEFREVIQQREQMEEFSLEAWNDAIDECWNKEIEILTANVPSTIEFFKTECTESECAWISEVLEDIVSRTKSQELLDAYVSLLEKYPELGEEYKVIQGIERAEAAL